ncbi:C4-dicarboxylate ABC transporter [Desulfosporosinus sp. SB140]|uniref:SLAC1 family transporter n=1 Tax=Desulfosporosinus paludis TaxID=3115649 RepID=UPI00388D892F
MLERHVVKYLAPGWFAVVMGTGGLANISQQWQNTLPAGHLLALVLAALADILYVLILIPWLIRWVSFFEYVQRDLHHPVTSNFFVTMPVATIIVGTNLYNIWGSVIGGLQTFWLSMLAWLIGIIGVTFFSFYTTFRMMQVEVTPKPETTNFSWIMAPIANMATLLLGNSVVMMSLHYELTWSMSILTVNLVMFGIGFFLFLFISAVVFVRLVQHPLPPAELTPSFGILLSAVGLATIALLDTSKSAQALGIVTAADFATLGAASVWGFGIWVIGIIGLISIYQMRKEGIPFSLGWWAYIFPLAAYTIASLKISALFITPLTYYWSAFLTILLIALWLYAFSNTLKGVFSGRLFLGKPIYLSSSRKCSNMLNSDESL